jgi:hypothetical protein
LPIVVLGTKNRLDTSSHRLPLPCASTGQREYSGEYRGGAFGQAAARAKNERRRRAQGSSSVDRAAPGFASDRQRAIGTHSRALFGRGCVRGVLANSYWWPCTAAGRRTRSGSGPQGIWSLPSQAKPRHAVPLGRSGPSARSDGLRLRSLAERLVGPRRFARKKEKHERSARKLDCLALHDC